MTETATPIPERLEKLPDLVVEHGGHSSFEEGHCAMELVAWLAGEPHSASPSCTSPILSSFLVAWNDAIDDDGRQQLKPYLPKVIGTAGDGQDELRGWLAADWLVRVCTSAWLELAGIEESATALRELPPLRDLDGLTGARPVIDRARKKSAAAWAAAWDAARDAAWAAARDAARDAAWDAAWAAARAAAWAAAWAAARAAAWTAARDAARDAAWAAAWAAARDAARDAASSGASKSDTYEAAYKAASEKVMPTSEGLKASALELLEAMIDPKAAAAA